MSNNIWGPSLWKKIHIASFNEKTNFNQLINYINNNIKCGICRKSFNIYLKHFPVNIFIDKQYGLSYLFYYIHNLVNAKLDKPLIEYKECYYIYHNMNLNNITVDQLLDFNDLTENINNTFLLTAKKCEMELLKDPDNPNKHVKQVKYKNFVYY